MRGVGWFIIQIAYILFGAWCISDAIKNFKKEHYFTFGVNLIIAIGCITPFAYYSIFTMF